MLRFDGVSLEELLLRHALGRTLPPLERDGSAVGVRMFYPPRAGTLRSIKGQATAEAVAGITGIRITAHRRQLQRQQRRPGTQRSRCDERRVGGKVPGAVGSQMEG